MKTKIFAAAGLAALALAVLPSQAFAAIAFNTFPLSYTAQTNHDLPLLDARNVTAGGSFSSSQADHNDGVAAAAGDTIEFQIYYHNTGVPEEQATNVMVRSLLPGGTRSSHEVSASISSDQTGTVSSQDSSHGGNISVNVGGAAQTMQFVSGSARWFPNRGSGGTNTLSNGDNVVSGGVNIGTIRGCFEFSGFVTFRARVGTTVVSDTRDLAINKRVMNVTGGGAAFADSTTARPGDRLRFEITAQTTGTASQTNVIVRDVLPTQLSFVSGSLREGGAAVGSESELFGSGRNLGSLSAGATRVFTFEAQVAGAGVFSGQTTITNTANVRSDQVSTRQDETPISISLVSGSSFTLRKTAFNLTKGAEATSVTADPGDTIVYNLYYRNTGSITNTGVVVEDNIADVKELALITNQGGAISVDGSIRYAPVDVPPGVEVSRTFEVRVRPVIDWPAGSDQIMTNIYGNAISISVRRPVGTTTVATTQPPRTGAGEWFAGLFAALTTSGYFLYRRKRQALSVN